MVVRLATFFCLVAAAAAVVVPAGPLAVKAPPLTFQPYAQPVKYAVQPQYAAVQPTQYVQQPQYAAAQPTQYAVVQPTQYVDEQPRQSTTVQPTQHVQQLQYATVQPTQHVQQPQYAAVQPTQYVAQPEQYATVQPVKYAAQPAVAEQRVQYVQPTQYIQPAQYAVQPVKYAAPVAVQSAEKLVYTEPEAPAQYEYEYSVQDPHSGDDKQMKESRNGDDVQGHYTFVQPDGIRRVVEYSSSKEHGFNAVVRYEGQPTVAGKVYTPVPQVAVAAPVAKLAGPQVTYATAPAQVSYAPAPVAYAVPTAKVAYATPAAKVAYAPANNVAYTGHVAYTSSDASYKH